MSYLTGGSPFTTAAAVGIAGGGGGSLNIASANTTSKIVLGGGHIEADSLSIGKREQFELFVFKILVVDKRLSADNKGIVYKTEEVSEIVKKGETPDKTKIILRYATEVSAALTKAGLTDNDVDFVFRKEFSQELK